MQKRMIIYSGAIPLDTDLLNIQRFAQATFSELIEGTLGSGSFLDGFTCVPTGPASMQVQVTPGNIFSLQPVDSNAFGSLGSDTVDQVMKIGALATTYTSGVLAAPSTGGFSQNFLVEIAFSEADTASTVLNYFNAANPVVPFSGPNNTGVSQNTQRVDTASVQIKPGIAAATGTQTTPSPDAGYVGAFVITIPHGATTLTSGNISAYGPAPFIPAKLPAVPAAIQNCSWSYAVDSGSANMVVASVSPAPAALTAGLNVSVKIAANNTGASTLNLNGLGAVAVVVRGGGALGSGELVAGNIADFQYDGTSWQLTSQSAFVASIPYIADTSGTPNTIAAVFSPAIAALTTGRILSIKVANTVTGATTCTVNALSAVNVLRSDGIALAPGDIVAGQIVAMEYDGAALRVVGMVPSQANAVSAPSVNGLIISNNTGTPNSKVDITSSSAILVNSAGAGVRYSGGTITVNLTTNGANGFDSGSPATSSWVYLYLIYNPVTNTYASLASASSTAPTLPSGYTYSARVGAAPVDGSGNLYRFVQKGRFGKYQITPATNTSTFPFIFSGSTSSAYAAKQVVGNGFGVPGTASAASLALAYFVQNAGGIVGLAPNASYTAPGVSALTNPFPPVSLEISVSSGIGSGSTPVDMELESNNVYYWSNIGASSLTVLGWIDSVNAC